MPFLNISLVSESFPFYRFGFHFIFNDMLVVILMVKWWFHKQMVFIISFLYVIIIILILSCFIFLLYCSHHKKHWFPIIHFPFNVSLFTKKTKWFRLKALWNYNGRNKTREQSNWRAFHKTFTFSPADNLTTQWAMLTQGCFFCSSWLLATKKIRILTNSYWHCHQLWLLTPGTNSGAVEGAWSA